MQFFFFNSCSENAFPCFCSFCRVAWNWPLITEIELFRIHRLLFFFSERCVTCHSRSPFNDTAQYISYKHDMHEPVRYVLDHLDKWHLIWYGSKVPRERTMWIEIYAHCCFCNDSTLFLIFSLIAHEIYEFFLGWWILFFFIRQWSRLYFPIKTVNKQSNTWSLVNSEFLFSCSTRRLTSERNELSANSSDIELNTRWEILCLCAPCIIRYFCWIHKWRLTIYSWSDGMHNW